jgi:hypothetical protein
MTAPTPAEAAQRLHWLGQRARGLSDVTYTHSVDTANPELVWEADTEQAARQLMARLVAVAEGLQALDVDPKTLGEAMDLVEAQGEVVKAVQAVAFRTAELNRALEALAAAQARARAEQGAGDLAAAQNAARAAAQAHKQARSHLQDCLRHAADLADTLRKGLRLRHGGMAEAHADAPVRAAECEFYGEEG